MVAVNDLTSYKLVHLKNLKEKSIEPIIDDFGIITSGAAGGTAIATGFRSSKTLIEAHPTASSDNSS